VTESRSQRNFVQSSARVYTQKLFACVGIFVQLEKRQLFLAGVSSGFHR
jgi:hypothetical protein